MRQFLCINNTISILIKHAQGVQDFLGEPVDSQAIDLASDIRGLTLYISSGRVAILTSRRTYIMEKPRMESYGHHYPQGDDA